MTDITSIRQQYPQYGDMSDEQLATALHQKFYSDMPARDFFSKIGMSKTDAAGAVLDETAGKGLRGLGRTAVAAGEVALSGAAGIAGDVGGALTSIATQDAKKGEKVKQALTYQPQTETGKAGAEYVGELLSPVSRVLDKPVQALEKSGHPILAQGVRAAEDIAPIKVPKVLREGRELVKPVAEGIAARGEAKAAAKTAETAEKNSLIQDVRKLGLRLTSQDIGAPIGKRVEAVASRPQLEREISYHNAKQAKLSAAADVGIKEPLSAGSINKAINETLVPYKAPRKLGRVNLAADDKFQQSMKQVEGITAQEQLDFPEDVNADVQKEVAKFNRPSADADTMVTKIAKLRERASDNFRGTADEKALARAQRAIATAMEEAIERHGDPATMKAFRDARIRLAKLYTLRDAMTESGELDLGVIEKQLNDGEPLSGNIRTLARAKSAFDRSFQNPDNIRGHPVGITDVALGALAGGGKGAMAGGVPGMAAGVAAAAARPVTRAVLGSAPYQRAFIRPKISRPSVATRAARRIAGKKSTIRDLPKERREPTLSDGD